MIRWIDEKKKYFKIQFNCVICMYVLDLHGNILVVLTGTLHILVSLIVGHFLLEVRIVG